MSPFSAYPLNSPKNLTIKTNYPMSDFALELRRYSRRRYSSINLRRIKKMKTVWRRLISCFLFLVISGPVFAQDSVKPASQNEDELAIGKNIGFMVDGWNTKSGALFAKPFAEDADYVVINGMHIRTQKVIEQGHQQIFDTIYKDSVLNLSVKQIRFLRPDIALVHVTGQNKTRRGETTTETKGIISMVMMKEAGIWKIVSFQNTQIAN
jgi:uncharacterized protein (TIGR02246 family)